MSRDFLPMVSAFVKTLHQGGLGQVISLRGGGSKTHFALSCLGQALAHSPESPPLSLWVSHEGFPYPALLEQRWKIPLSRFLLVKVNAPMEVWKVGLEATQMGLFDWIFIRPSVNCHAHHLRRLQIQAERTRCRILLLPQTRLPHWPFKISYELQANPNANTLLSKSGTARSPQRGMSLPHPKGIYPESA